MSSPPRASMKTASSRVLSNPIGHGPMSAAGTETFAHFHDEGQQRQRHLSGESSSQSVHSLTPSKTRLSGSMPIVDSQPAEEVSLYSQEAEPEAESQEPVKVGEDSFDSISFFESMMARPEHL